MGLDFSDDVDLNSAAICFPGEAPQLLSEYFGSSGDVTQAFLVRLITWDDAGGTADEALSYEVVRGPAADFPDVASWTMFTPEAAGDTNLVDAEWGALDPGLPLRYAVRTVYASGESRWTFTMPVNPVPSSVDNMGTSSDPAQIQPSLAKIGTPLELLGWSVDEILVLDERGRRIDQVRWTSGQFAQGQLLTAGCPAGVVHIMGIKDGQAVAKARVVLMN